MQRRLRINLKSGGLRFSCNLPHRTLFRIDVLWPFEAAHGCD